MYCFEYFVIFLPIIAIVLTEKSNETAVKIVEWSDCGGPNATVRWEDVRIPEPMRLTNLLAGARYRLLDEVKPGSYSKVEVWRVIQVLIVPVHVKIPCRHKFGSCQYDLCEVSDIDNFCNFNRVHSTGCGCPMGPKLVEGYNFKIKIPDKMTTFQSLFAEGTYRIKWTWYNPSGQSIGCIEGEGSLIPV